VVAETNRREGVTGVTYWVIDWDIPRKPSSRRRQFYRRLWKLRDAHVDPGFTSSFSVLVTMDECLAKDIFELAKQYGRTRLFEARIIAEHRGGYSAILPPWTLEYEGPGETSQV